MTVTPRQLQAARRFIAGACARPGAAALVGNDVQESGPDLDSTIDRPHPDWSGGLPLPERSGGIAEWLGARKAAEKEFAAARGVDPNDLDLQCDFTLHELQSDPRYRDLWVALRDPAQDVGVLALRICDEYERPKKGPTANRAGRVKYARAVALALAAPDAPASVAAKSSPHAMAGGSAAGAAVVGGVAYVQHGPNVVSLAVLAGVVALGALYLLALLARRLDARGSPRAQQTLKMALANYRAASAALAAARAAVAAEVAEAQSLLSQM